MVQEQAKMHETHVLRFMKRAKKNSLPIHVGVVENEDTKIERSFQLSRKTRKSSSLKLNTVLQNIMTLTSRMNGLDDFENQKEKFIHDLEDLLAMSKTEGTDFLSFRNMGLREVE